MHVIASPLWPGYRPSEKEKKQPFTGSLQSACSQGCSALPFYFKGVLVVVLTLETLPARTCIILPIWYRLSEYGMINTQRLHCNSFIAICNPSTKLQNYCCCTEEFKNKNLEMCVSLFEKMCLFCRQGQEFPDMRLKLLLVSCLPEDGWSTLARKVRARVYCLILYSMATCTWKLLRLLEEG